MIEEITHPQKNLNSPNDSIVSKWNAVHHPVKFEFQRKDLEIDTVQEFFISSIQINSSDSLSELVVGESIYVYSEGVYDGVYEITLINTGLGFFVVDCPFISDTTGGFFNINARKNYYLETKIFDSENNYLGASINKPNDSGLIEVDTSTWLKSKVDYKDVFGYSEVCEDDTTLGGAFFILYTEYYNGNSQGDSIESDLFYYTNSAKQIGDVYGSNMGEYLAFANEDVSSTAKFMSDFIRPTYFNGFPFSLSVIWSEYMLDFLSNDFQIGVIKKSVDGSSVNAGPIGVPSGGGSVRRFLINEDNTVYPESIDYLTAYIYNSELDVIVTEQKDIKVNKECAQQPVFLNWLGTNSGRNYFLFKDVQSEVEEIQSTGEFNPQSIDLETDLGNSEYLGKVSQPELICTAYLEIEDIKGLKGLLRSPDVLMLTNPETWKTDNTDTSPPSVLPKWQRVKVLPQTYKILDTNQTHALIEITLLLPTINIQQQ